MITKLQSTLRLLSSIALSNGDLGLAYDLDTKADEEYAEMRGEIDSEIMRQ